jgi:acyl-coenzyme A thioesterase PaaI-like protein
VSLLYKFIAKTNLLSPKRRLELYPPFRAMRIRITEMSDDWSAATILLPLNRHNRNPGGGMFGGAMASLADPIPALMCARLFPGHAVWTRAMTIDFRREGRTDLLLRIAIDPEHRESIGQELQTKQRATPAFEYAFFDEDGHLCAQVINTVAIRPAGYRPGKGALGKIHKR